MQKYSFTAIITSYNEADLIADTINKLIIACDNYSQTYQIIVMAGDVDTYNTAKKFTDTINTNNSTTNTTQQILVLNDGGNGKPNALNIAVQNAKYDWLVFTDGDVQVDQHSITSLFDKLEKETIAVSGHPVSMDNRSTMFGYFSHLFCEAANIKRQSNEFVPMSGYLFLTKKLHGLFPIPTALRAEDAYISHLLIHNNHRIAYAKDALVYVKFPKNLNDWLKQKTRSLGGNVQLSKFTANLPQCYNDNQNQISSDKLQDKIDNKQALNNHTRNILQDVKMLFFPLTYAKNAKEIFYSLLLYPLRLYLWLVIYKNHLLNRYKNGRWEHIQSSKI